MIARDAGDGGLLLIRQDDHAHLTGPLADAWRADVPRRGETVRASAIHDDGWSAWDDAPRVDAGGAPFTYRSMPPDDYRALWRRGFADAWGEGAWVGLLVSLHGAQFFEWKKDSPADARVLADERARQRAALTELGWPDASPPDALPDAVARAFALVRYLDGLSLFACEEWDAGWSAEAPGPRDVVKFTATRPEPTRIALDPWPFTRHVVPVRVPARRVAGSRWPDDAAYRRALREAEPVVLSWELAPA